MLKAEFIGYQDMGDGNYIPLFNLVGNHPLQNSTVGLSTLIELGVTVPNYQNNQIES